MNFKSLIQLLDYFKDEDTCIEYFKKIRWNGNPTCPHCGAEKPYVTNRGYKCRNKVCYKKFTVKVGTYLENSKISMRTWFAAIYILTTSKKGVSSVQIGEQLGITQKTAWFLLHRIREMLKDQEPIQLDKDKVIEVDETYVGGKEKNKHYWKKRSKLYPEKTNEGGDYVPKKTVVGVIERGGKVALRYVPTASSKHLLGTIKAHVPKGATVYTDEYKGYAKLHKNYDHHTVNHSHKIFTRGDVHTNSIENFWSILKRGIIGVYHHVSGKHIKNYLNEFSARFNTRFCTKEERFNTFLGQSNGRLRYSTLIGK